MIPSSLVTRIVIVALLLLTAITSILSYVVVSEDFAEEQANLDAGIELIIERFVPIATRATYQLDVQLAEQVVESILSAEYVIGAKITHDLGQELATRIRYLEISPNPLLAAVLEPHEQIVRLPLLREDPFEVGQVKQYGTLEIGINRLVALSGYAERDCFPDTTCCCHAHICRRLGCSALLFVITPARTHQNQLSQLESGNASAQPQSYGLNEHTRFSNGECETSRQQFGATSHQGAHNANTRRGW